MFTETMATQQTAITQYALVNGVKAAYRQLGKSSGIPLVMMVSKLFGDAIIFKTSHSRFWNGSSSNLEMKSSSFPNVF